MDAGISITEPRLADGGSLGSLSSSSVYLDVGICVKEPHETGPKGCDQVVVWKRIPFHVYHPFCVAAKSVHKTERGGIGQREGV